MLPEQTGRGRTDTGQAHELAGKGRLAAGLAVAANGKVVGGVAYVLEKEQLRRAFPQGQGIAPARQEDAVSHIAGAAVGMAVLVSGLGDGRQRKKAVLSGFFQRTRFGFGRLEAEKRTDEIRIHIPAKGKLLEEECQKSYERASAFFHLSRIATESWLLAPWLKALGEDSGIVRFAKRYKLVEVIEDRTNADAWRIFGKCDPTKPESLREDTRLQRLAKAHLVAGGYLDRGYGFFTI